MNVIQDSEGYFIRSHSYFQLQEMQKVCKARGEETMFGCLDMCEPVWFLKVKFRKTGDENGK